MKREQTAGERIAKRIVAKVKEYGGDFDYSQREYAKRQIANALDRAIRPAQAKAWDDAIDAMERVRSYVVARSENPYRARRK